MTADRQRPDMYNSLLQALLVAGIFAFVLCAVWMFMTGNACSVSVSGILAAYFLVFSVGVTLITRWRRLGAWIVALANIALAAVLIQLYPIWLSETFGSDGAYILAAITGTSVILTAVPLFILKDKASKRSLWKAMDGGIDWKHFRHIYELTLVLLVGVAAVIAVKGACEVTAVEPSETEEAYQVPAREVSAELLDSADVTLAEIAQIEEMNDSVSSATRKEYSNRIFALKHVLLSGLMVENHDVENLLKIYKIHADEFSPSQQKIFDWYIALPKSDQALWVDCPPVNSIAEFEREMKNKISTRK